MSLESINDIFRSFYIGKLFVHSEDSNFIRQEEYHYNLTSLEKNNFSFRHDYVTVKKGDISLLTNISNKENVGRFFDYKKEIVLELYLLVSSKKCVIKYPLLIELKKDMLEISNFSFENCSINLLEKEFKSEL